MPDFSLTKISAGEGVFMFKDDQSGEVWIGNSFNTENETTSEQDSIVLLGEKSKFTEGAVLENVVLRDASKSSNFVHGSSVEDRLGKKVKHFLPKNSKYTDISQYENTVATFSELAGSMIVRDSSESFDSRYPRSRTNRSTKGGTTETGSDAVVKQRPTYKEYYELIGDENSKYYELDTGQLYRLGIAGLELTTPRIIVFGVKNNFVGEFDSTIYPINYIDGIDYGNHFPLKNCYDVFYDRVIDESTVEELGVYLPEVLSQVITRLDLFNARQYVSIGTDTDYLWTSYLGNLKYQYQRDGDTIVLDKVGGYDLKRRKKRGSIEAAQVTVESIGDAMDEYLEFEYLEVIKGSNKFTVLPKHKSNLYSIEIKNSGVLSDSSLSNEKRSLIQTTINNIIREVVPKITPAHTKLLNIYWSGK